MSLWVHLCPQHWNNKKDFPAMTCMQCHIILNLNFTLITICHLWSLSWSYICLICLYSVCVPACFAKRVFHFHLNKMDVFCLSVVALDVSLLYEMSVSQWLIANIDMYNACLCTSEIDSVAVLQSSRELLLQRNSSFLC